MKIWYNDPNFPSGITPFIVEAGETSGIDLREKKDMSSPTVTIKSNPDYFIANPSALSGDEYYENLKGLAKFYSDTTFLVTAFTRDTRAKAKSAGLDSLGNVEILGIRTANSRLSNILKEANVSCDSESQ